MRVTDTPVRCAARNRISFITPGQASASTQILAPATFRPSLRIASRREYHVESVFLPMDPGRERHAHRRVVAVALFAPIRGVLLFLAKAIHDAAQDFRFDAL